jgi:maltose alpha-D-glucosyltransferase / alpha-amylase
MSSYNLSVMNARTHWWKNAKLYELYVDAFAGRFAGLAEHLPYFTQLGINCLHILPHFPSPMIDDGYDVADYRGVRAALGTIDDCTRCIEKAHRRGIRVIIDFVLNHTSDRHPWFVEARSSRDNPKRDFYLWSASGTDLAGAVNAFPDFKSQNWIPDPATGDYYFATFYPQQPDLNWDNPQVFEEMLANMEFWATRGVDGFRLDAAPHLVKREGTTSKGLPETHQLLKRIRRKLETKYPDVILLAEAVEDIEPSKEYFGAGDECHMVYNFSLAAHLWLTLCDGSRSSLDAALARSCGIPESCQWATFLRNHDQLALDTLSSEERRRLNDFLDPKHEYLFNKGEATCMRIASALHGDIERILDAIDLLYGLPGAPIMYYGDEIGIQNIPVRDLERDTRRYVRGPFDWKTANAQLKDPASLLSRVSRIIKRSR